jgi:hypothetical protein
MWRCDMLCASGSWAMSAARDVRVHLQRIPTIDANLEAKKLVMLARDCCRIASFTVARRI